MKRLLQFFGIGKKAKAKAESKQQVKETIVVPEKPHSSKVYSRKTTSSVDTRWQVKKHRHNKIRAKNRSARRMRTYNKIYA